MTVLTVLRTPRLIIRPLTGADLPALVAYRNDPEVARYQGWPLPYEREQARELISDAALGAPGWVQRALTDHAGTLLGDVALNTEGPQAELGITLARHAQGRGYAQEAVRAVLDFAFCTLGLHRVHAGIDPQNAPVARLLTRLGFRHEGTHRQSYWHARGADGAEGGEWTDEAVYALLKGEWNP